MSESTEAGAWLERAGAIVPIRGGLTIGRSRNSGLVLADDRVSRRHAVINAQDGPEYWLVDFGSSNGTYLNGRRIVKPMRLSNGDRIGIAPFEMTFRCLAFRGRRSTRADPTQMTVVDISSFSAWLLLLDVIGSSRLMQELRPQEVAVLIGTWLANCREILEKDGGIIDKYLGDGFLAFWNLADTDASAVARALVELKALQTAARPAFRLIMHQGKVARGLSATPPDSERTFGRDIHYVFRMEQVAKALGRERLISKPAWRTLGRHLATEDLGAHSMAQFGGLHPFYSF